ncbi:MAG: hypothetical protein HDR19_03020 [Lachnospiraceae bacterium]|nr:hypothetical protein [Lachnospiraceae bacterium]
MSMRITTQMLNETSRKAGLPVNSNSLLNYINNDKNSNSLLESLQNSSKTTDLLQNKKLYQKLKDAAESLEDATKTLGNEKSDNIFAKAKESGDNADIVKNVKTLIEQYNEVRKQLERDASSPINAYYNQTLGQLASKNKEELSKVGITIGKDGSMTIDESKLKEASVEDLESLFGSKSEFIQKMQYLASHVSNNVSAQIESLGNQYGQDANSFSSYISNKYDWWS